MTPRPASGRTPLVLSIAALLIAAGTASGPALATTYHKLVNADTVDGLHAVKATTPAKHRKGKLVATSPKNGKLPNNIIKRAPDSAKLGGHTSGYYLSVGSAATTYLTPAQASVTYDTVTRADATYESKAEAAKLINPVQAYSLQTTPPAFPTTSVSIAQATVTTTAPGPMVIDTSFLMPSFSCATAGNFGAWYLNLDGADIATSFTDTPSTGGAYPFSIHAMTALSVPVGSHVLQLRFGCQGSVWSSVSYLTHYFLVTTLQSGGGGPAVVHPSSSSAHSSCTVRRGEAAVCR